MSRGMLWLRIWRWRTRWFPYRTADFLGVDENGEMLLGPWVWNRPRRKP